MTKEEMQLKRMTKEEMQLKWMTKVNMAKDDQGRDAVKMDDQS